MRKSLEYTEIQKNLAEISKMNQETRKIVIEANKLFEDTRLTSKKATWYEFTMLLALVGAVIAFTKLFLT